MVKIAKKDDCKEINLIRKEVLLFHAKVENEYFKTDFNQEFQDYIYEFFDSESKYVFVSINNGKIVGYAMIDLMIKPETPYRRSLKFVEIVEIGVLENYRDGGIGTELINFIKDFAKEKGFNQLKLDVWNFNKKAMNFYKKNGFEDYRTFFRMHI